MNAESSEDLFQPYQADERDNCITTEGNKNTKKKYRATTTNAIFSTTSRIQTIRISSLMQTLHGGSNGFCSIGREGGWTKGGKGWSNKCNFRGMWYILYGYSFSGLNCVGTLKSYFSALRPTLVVTKIKNQNWHFWFFPRIPLPYSHDFKNQIWIHFCKRPIK